MQTKEFYEAISRHGWNGFVSTAGAGYCSGTSTIVDYSLAHESAAIRIIVLDSFARFALQGLGTPAPVLPTRHLVVSGLYQYVRNPMYVGVLGIILGQGLLFGDGRLFTYGVLLWLVVHVFVVGCEEPTLRRSFGTEYEAFRRNVPRWIPRLSPWQDGAGT